MADSAITFTAGEVSTYFALRVPQLNQRRATEWRGPCPIHHGKNDNFAVEANTGRYPSDQPRLASRRGPTGGSETGNFCYVARRHAGQHGEQIAFHRDTQAAAGFDHRENRRNLRSGLRATHVQPVLAAQRDWAHGVLGQIVGQFDFGVIETAPQLRPHI